MQAQPAVAPAQPAQWHPWEVVVRYSGATVPDFHGVPSHLAVDLGPHEPPPKLSKNKQQLQFQYQFASKIFPCTFSAKLRKSA